MLANPTRPCSRHREAPWRRHAAPHPIRCAPGLAPPVKGRGFPTEPQPKRKMCLIEGRLTRGTGKSTKRFRDSAWLHDAGPGGHRSAVPPGCPRSGRSRVQAASPARHWPRSGLPQEGPRRGDVSETVDLAPVPCRATGGTFAWRRSRRRWRWHQPQEGWDQRDADVLPAEGEVTDEAPKDHGDPFLLTRWTGAIGRRHEYD